MITRTIYWNESASGWYDLKTDVYVGNLDPPQDSYPEDVQPEGWYHPFDKSYAVTYEQVQKMIADAFMQRVIPEVPPYMMDGDWLVTYKWLQREGDYCQSSINELQRQVEELKSRRWWK